MKNILTISLLSLAMLVSAHLSVQAQKKKKSKKDYVITIATSLGEINALLFDETPKHKENFIKLAEEGFFNGTTFHRVIKNFMIQGGDPNSKEGADNNLVGRGGPGYTLDAEIISKYEHDKGMIAAARRPDPVNPEKASSGSQFYIVQNPDGAHHLDGNYSIFGKVIKGLDVVDKIANVKVKSRGRPEEDVRMQVSVVKLKKKKISKLYQVEFEQ